MPLTQQQYRQALNYNGPSIANVEHFTKEAISQSTAINRLAELLEAKTPFVAKYFNGKKARLFLSECKRVCQLNKGSSRSGFALANHWDEDFRVKSIELLEDVENARQIKSWRNQIKTVEKYRDLANKASFTNKWIKDCKLAIPLLSAYENRLTSGVRIDGQVISVEAVAKAIEDYFGRNEANNFRKALANKENYNSGRFPFRGYDGSVQLKVNEETDEFWGWFNKEYKDCGNGYYYLLINDESWIGYDID